MMVSFRRLIGLCTILGVSLLAFSSAGARNWNPTPESAAQEYVLIQHTISPGNIILVMWASPALVPASVEGGQDAKRVLAEYPTFGWAHLSLDQNGQMVSVGTPSATVETLDGRKLEFRRDNEIPAIPKAVLTAFTGTFSQNLGVLGTAMEWATVKDFAFSPCENNGIFVVYNGTKYDFRAPIPGC